MKALMAQKWRRNMMLEVTQTTTTQGLLFCDYFFLDLSQ